MVGETITHEFIVADISVLVLIDRDVITPLEIVFDSSANHCWSANRSLLVKFPLVLKERVILQNHTESAEIHSTHFSE